MRKRVLVLSANPKRESYVDGLAEAYVRAAEENHDVKLMKLSDMDFEPDLSLGYDDEQPLEDVLLSFQSEISWCDHLVIFTPIWWGSLPAKLKGLFDRTFLPGFAFQYQKGNAFPKKLLKGKTARIVMTMDTPPWYYVLFQGAPAVKQLKTTTLKFVGFESVKSKMLGPIINSTDQAREKWLAHVSKLGAMAA